MSPISVVIPAYNEAELLPRALAALMPQAKKFGAEVIVVDNNSTDATATIAAAHGATVVTEQKSGYVFAVQAGLQRASGDIVAFTDADTVVADDWLETILIRFNGESNLVALSGPITFQDMPYIAWSRVFFRRSLVGSNMAVRRSAAVAVGGFDTSYNLASDIAFGWRLATAGRVSYEQKMRVTTSPRRFQASPLKEGLRYSLNYIWMVLFHRPLIWNFSAIRGSADDLTRKARRRTFAWSAVGIVAVLLYLSAWPSSTVFGQIATRGNDDHKTVALTFDDGPNGQPTRTIVDILKANNVPATFFEVGRSIQADPATTDYVHHAGFPIENHSWDHSFRLPFMTPQHIHDELTTTSQLIEQETGIVPTLFRPPHGFRSAQLLYEADRLHLRVIDWSVNPQDYNTNDPKTIVDRVVSGVHDGSIILLHDGLQDGPHAKSFQARQGTIQALPQIINQLRQRGYTFVSLSELLPSSVQTNRLDKK